MTQLMHERLAYCAIEALYNTIEDSKTSQLYDRGFL